MATRDFHEVQEHSSSSGRSSKEEPRSCLVLDRNDVFSSILLVVIFGDVNPTSVELTHLFVPMHSTAAISSRQDIAHSSQGVRYPAPRKSFSLAEIVEGPKRS